MALTEFEEGEAKNGKVLHRNTRRHNQSIGDT